MALEYKGFNIPEKVIIVKTEIYKWQHGERIGTGEYQGYVVTPDNKSMLETALNWAGCEYEYKDGKHEYHDKEKYITEYVNGTFELSLTYAASNSSQSGKLSFWDCTIKAEDGQKYLIGINSDLLCNLLINSTFINGVCQAKIYLGRQKGRVGAFTDTMDEFIQAKKDAELRTRKMSTKYEPGQRVFTKTDQSVYLGEMYKLFNFEDIPTKTWPYSKSQIVFYTKPIKVHVYGTYKYEYSTGLRNWIKHYDLNQLDGVRIDSNKTNQYFNEGDIFDISPTYEEYCKIRDTELQESLARYNGYIQDCHNRKDEYRSEDTFKRDIQRYERDKQRAIVTNAFEKINYSDKSENTAIVNGAVSEEILEIIKNYLAYANRFSNPNTDRIKDYDIVIR